MSYNLGQSMPAERSLDLPSLFGFLLASVGAGALASELLVRGWWGFATSGVELIVILTWLTLSGGLCWWAFEQAAGWWQVLAFIGLVISVIAVAVLACALALRFLLENPDILTEDRKQQRKGRRRRRTRGHGPW